MPVLAVLISLLVFTSKGINSKLKLLAIGSMPCVALLHLFHRPISPPMLWSFLQATPIFDSVVFNKVKERLGGRVRLIISGEGDTPRVSEGT